MLAAIPYPQFDPVIVHLGPLAIRWYGVAYLAAFLMGYGVMIRLIHWGKLRITTDDMSDLFGWLVLGVIAGGRLGWWFVYHRDTGRPEPWYEPIAMWHGGMSFHGGLIGVILALLIWCWAHPKAAFWNLADCMALVTPIGLFFGRIANFINAELVGRPTNMPWGVIFPHEDFPRHPSQIYEAMLEGPLLMLILWAFFKYARPREGRIASLFLIFYGLFRFGVEFTRQPDVQIGFIAFGWLTMGQLLSVLLSLVGVGAWIWQPAPSIPMIPPIASVPSAGKPAHPPQ